MTEAAPVSASDSDGALPLEGTTVVILGAAAAYSGRLLAGMGATVVLIEPLTGCAERRGGPFAPGPLRPSSSLSFAFNAAGLRSVALDATTEDGAEVLTRCLRAAGLCIDALAWQPAGDWVDACAAALAAGDTPVCRIGPEGDLAGIGADDLLVQAASGLMYISGFPDRPPASAPDELAKMQTALFGATAALAALGTAGQEGSGWAMRVSAQAAASLMTLQTSNPAYLTWRGMVPRRTGAQGLAGAPIRCKDGWVTFTVPGERWPAFLTWAEECGVATDGLPRVLDGQVESMRDALAAAEPVIRSMASMQSQREFYHNAQRRGLLSMPINTIAGILGDEHLEARGFFTRDVQGGAELVAPFRSEPTLWRPPAAAPRLGEHTEQFLTEWLGYSREDVESLLAMGAISCGL